jgi:predicted ATPase/class 3 adenylate cyclase
MAELPSGTVTLLFSDIEGSTRLLTRLGERYAGVLADHQRLLRAAVERHGGREMDTQGDSFFIAFARAGEAVAAAVEAQRALAAYRWPEGLEVRVRMGLHSGEPAAGSGRYVGLSVHRAARICSAAHGGQVLLSNATRELVEDELPPDVGLRDVGEHRLKDLDRPVRLFQVVVHDLPADFPLPRSLDARLEPAAFHGRLPRLPNATIGREPDVRAVLEWLHAEKVRLLTFTGPGGVGKTRLVIESARCLAPDFADGACFAELASVSKPRNLASAIARALGAPIGEGEPPKTALLRFLGYRHLLLVLDNFEHLLVGAPLIGELLAESPGLTVLVTSREPTRLAAERRYLVRPLEVPARATGAAAAELELYGAVAMFLDRARARDPDCDLNAATAPHVVEICRRLDGLPLAIELAAAWVGLLSVAEIVARLGIDPALLSEGSRDAPARQTTLRATLDWSYRLLTADERDAFAALAVFAGGATLDAAEAVTQATLRSLDGLVAKSLVMRRDGRLVMLQTIREYALDRLGEGRRGDEVRGRHAVHYLGLARGLAPDALVGRPDATHHLEAETDNLRAAVAWTAEHAPAVHVELLITLGDYWWLPSLRADGRAWIDAAVRAHGSSMPPERAARLVLARAFLLDPNDPERPPCAREALARFEELGDPVGETKALGLLSEAETMHAQWTTANALAERAVERARTTGSDVLIGFALSALSVAQEQFSEALPLARESAAYLRRVGATRPLARLLSITAWIAIEFEAYADAERLLAEGLEVAKERQDVYGVAKIRANQGLIAVFRKKWREASTAFEEDIELMSDPRFLGHFDWEAILGLAAVAAGQDHAERAAWLSGAARAWRDRVAEVIAPVYERLEQRFLEPARSSLGDAAWQRAVQAGASAARAEVIASALAPTTLAEIARS